MSVHKCCISGFAWSGTPKGREDKLASNSVYITGDNPDAAILFIADLFGWTFPNVRLLADHYAEEAGVTVYVPDFFGGEVLDFDKISAGAFGDLDLPGFIKRNGRELREPEIFECARALRAQLGYKKVGAVGYCYGGWACLRLGAREFNEPGAAAGGTQPLVDCISIGHPSLVVESDIDEVAVPTQILAPERDAAYNAELKLRTFQKLQTSAVPFDYQHFPGVEHACFIRGDESKPGERAAMIRGKNAAVAWFKQYLS
ncbi:dienelactone hydrolase family protein [Xylariales sp. PMI_506]|nr:dienelactone hydrolase family protein [Xylariales sp. PMI_506]